MVNTQYLKTFRVLAETHSFIATAKKLNMTQPGVSQHLKRLEEYFDVVLADRKGRFFQLTEAGHKLVAYCDKLFVDHDRFRSDIAIDEPTAGICNIASPGSFGLMLYSFLLELNLKHLALKMHFTVAPNTSVIQGVIDEKFQIGFISVNSSDAGVTKRQVSQEKLLLVAPKKVKIKSYSDLVATGFIAHPDGYHHATRLLSENYPGEFKTIEDIPLNGFINQVNRILDPVAGGMGFSVLPEYAVRAYPQKQNLQIIKLAKQVVDPIFCISKQNSSLPKRYSLLQAELQEHLKNIN